MPPTAKISRQLVLQAAMDVARSEGLSAISARRIANELNCSTQPVYRVFGSMEMLKKELIKNSEQLAEKYLIEESPTEDRPFFQFGLGILRFAQEEPQLFKIASLSGRFLRELRQGKTPPDFVLQKMKTDKHFSGLTDDQLTRIHTMLWFFSQGLTVLFTSEQNDGSMETAQQYLQLAGQAFIESELKGSKP